MLLAIDPGIDTGWAEFHAGNQLYRCGLGDPRKIYRHVTPESVIIEKPQVYRAANSKGDPNDLITLAVMVGEYKQFCEWHHMKVELVLPRQWKGQMPKDVCARRVLKRLDSAEQVNMRAGFGDVPESLRHNIMDAIGIGLWRLGRL